MERLRFRVKKRSNPLASKELLISSPLISRALAVAKELGMNIYLVGGPLRDRILTNRAGEIKDIDLVVDGDSLKFAKRLSASLKGKVFYYPQFMTARIIHRDGYIDLARTRKEIYASPGKLPNVLPAPIEEDLKRRDFTINALAYDLKKRQLIDPLKGEEDLRKGLIRVIHQNSFIDDPTRILRAIRFAVRLNFKIERNTLRWMKSAIKGNYLRLLSGERFLQELRIIMEEEKWLNMIKVLKEFGIFKSYFGKNPPAADLPRLRRVSQNSRLLYILSFFDTAKLPLTKEEKREIECFRKVSLLKKRLLQAKRPSTIYRLLKDFTPTSLTLIKEILPESKKRIEDYLQKYIFLKTYLTGKELKRLGIKPEREYGAILRRLLYRKLDGKVKTREDELKSLRLMIGKR